MRRSANLLIPLTVLSTAIQLQLAGLRRFARLAIFSVVQVTTNAAAIAIGFWGLGWGVPGAVAVSISV